MATNSALKGLAVTITLIDPWDFVTEHGSGPFPATVLGVRSDGEVAGGNALLLKLETPIHHGETSCEYFVALPRATGDRLEDLSNGQSVDCGLTCISEEQARSGNPFDLSKWRGGIALLASLQRVPR